MTTSELPEEMADEICDLFLECCSTASEFSGETSTPGLFECRETNSYWYGTFMPALEESIAAGRIEYHPDPMRACMDELAAMPCIDAIRFLQHGGLWMNCPEAFEGQVAAGGPCGTDWDCTSGYCAGDTVSIDGSIGGFGVCAELPTVGMECGDYRCAAGAFCNDAGTCSALLPDGSDCYTDSQCASSACTGPGRNCGERTRCDGVD